jgi:tetratricopeptide (TPR) repeat protein
LSTTERLKLFVQVCQAVQHAHQKGIIHRDIKPTNVMVTLHDGVPVPKVIDFGIAKAVNRQLTEKTLFTRYAQMIGTPAYMSPEQAEMSGLDIDIRTDVFSLGTLLYELLTGSPPFTSEYLLSKGYEEMQRIIREEEPTRPSTKLSTLGEARIDVAKRRATSPDVLHKLIRADLDWVVMKTLEKDRNRRYDSVSEFAADIKRYLNHEPVLTGPPSPLYRIKKFVQRHHVLVTASTVVAAVVIVGLVVSTSLYLRMRQALSTVSQLENKVEIDSKLSSAQRLYAEGRYQAALNEIEAVLDAQNPEPKAQLLKARIHVELGRLKEAQAQLLPLTKANPEIAGAAYYLLARINVGIDDSRADKYEAVAASMLPDTAEAYCLRAITAPNPQEALQWLDRAITLDPSDYPSRKARALTYYRLGEDEKMIEDVGALIALRPADSLGYALRAVLRRAAGLLQAAITDHTRAIELCGNKTDLSDLYSQRYETYTEMGDHAAALKDARRLAELEPQDFFYHFNVFTSLIALKDFAEAQRQYRQIVRTSHQWYRNFTRYVNTYVFNILDEGQALAFPPEFIHRAPFAQMQRASDCYYTLTSVATPYEVQRQGMVPYAWSPDSKQLLCGWTGMYGGLRGAIRRTFPAIPRAPALKVINVETGEEHHVATSHGGIPAWSPDGKYVAYPDMDGSFYVVPAEGGQARKIGKGYWPQWAQDSLGLYYRANRTLCFIHPHDPDSIPETLMGCPGSFAINEAENWIALADAGGISIVDFSTKSLLYQCPTPWPLSQWRLCLSADGRELSFYGMYSQIDTDVFVLDTHSWRLYRFLNYPVDRFARSPDGSRLAVGAKRDIWMMEVDPNFPTCQILGQEIPANDLVGYTIEQYTQAIAADPLYPENYLERALAYMSLDQYGKAGADLEQFDALITRDDHFAGYAIFECLRQYYLRRLYEQAEFLAPHAEKLMNRFPEDMPSYRDLILKIIEENESNSKNELAERWRLKLQELDKR